MDFKTILYEKADGVGTITLNRPEKLNAINFEMLEEVWSVLQEVVVDQEVRVILLTGEGRYFAAGADLEILAALEHRTPPRCPVCNGALSVSEVAPRSDVAYVRRRIWASCAACRRATTLDVPRGDRGNES